MEKNILGQNIFWEGWFLEHGLLSIGGSCHNYHFCHGKTHLLSLQKYACRFVATNIILSWQAYFCHTHTKNTCVLRQNTSFVATKVCYMFVATKICHNKIFCRNKFCCSKHTFDKNYTCGSHQWYHWEPELFLLNVFWERERKKKQHFLNVHTHTIHTKKQGLCSAGFLKQSISWK